MLQEKQKRNIFDFRANTFLHFSQINNPVNKLTFRAKQGNYARNSI